MGAQGLRLDVGSPWRTRAVPLMSGTRAHKGRALVHHAGVHKKTTPLGAQGRTRGAQELTRPCAGQGGFQQSAIYRGRWELALIQWHGTRGLPTL